MFVAVVVVASLAAVDARADSISVHVDDGKANSSGDITIKIKYKDANGDSQDVSIKVPVKKGETRETIRDHITNALKNDNKVSKDFEDFKEDSSRLAGLHYVKAKGKAGVQVISVSLENTDLVSNISTSGGGFHASLKFHAEGFFSLSGEIAAASDLIGVKLNQSTDFNFAIPDVYALSSYEGLSADQIMVELAALIDASLLYEADVVGDKVVITGDFNPNYGVDLFTSETTTDLGGVSGVEFVPEPATLALLSFGFASLILARKRSWSRQSAAV